MQPLEIAECVAKHLAPVMMEGDFDIVPDTGGGVDIATDNWSLHIEDALAFLAIDDEPDSPAEFPSAIDRALPRRVLDAIAAADLELSETLTDLLAATGDPFTNAVLERLKSDA